MKRVLATFLVAAFAPFVFAQRPTVEIIEPTNGQTFASGWVSLAVEATDSDGSVARVDYYVNGMLSEWSSQPPRYDVGIFCTPGRYQARAIAYDNVGYYAESAPIYFQVGGEIPVSLLRGPWLQSCTATSIVVRWRTDWPTNSIVRYGTNEPAQFAVTNHARTSEHAVLLNNLIPGTRYFYSFASDAQNFGGNYTQSFRTSPTNAQPFNVWAIGDFGTVDENQGAVRDAFLDSDFPSTTDVWLMLGDNAYEDGTDDEYQDAVFGMYDMLLPNIPVWPTIGNHDASLPDASGCFPYLDIFHLPVNGEAGGVASGTERYYSFDYANVHFVSLDSQTSDRSTNGAMLRWLREDLAATDKEWIVAFWHHPPYSSGTHFSDTELPMVEMRERALPILEAFGTDLVLAGHSHVYERSYLINGHYGRTNTFSGSMKLDGRLGRADAEGPYRRPAGGLGANHGTVYVVCGCSGQGETGNSFFYGEQPCMVRSLGGFGSMILQFNHLRVDVKFLRPDGTLGDYFTIDKSQPGTARPELALMRTAQSLEISWPTSVPEYALERALEIPSPQWLMVTNPVLRIGRRNRVTLPFSATNEFFQLKASF